MKKILLFLLLVFPIVAKAQLELPFPIKLVNSAPIDFWYFESDGTPYDNTGEVTTQVLSAIRYIGQTFNVNGVEYWFKDGITDGDLIAKGGSSLTLVDGNGTTVNGTGDGVDLGGTLTGNVAIDGSYTIDIGGTTPLTGIYANASGTSSAIVNSVSYVNLSGGVQSSIISGGNGVNTVMSTAYNSFTSNFNSRSRSDNTGYIQMNLNTGSIDRIFKFDETGTTLNIGSDASQDLYKRDPSGYLVRIPLGSSGDVLTNVSGTVGWAAPSGGGAWSLASGGTATGTNTFAMGSNPFILTSGVTTGTGATAGIQNVFNSLTTGNGLDISSSSVSSGAIVKITGTGTAAASNTQKGLWVAMSGANATSTQTTYGGYFSNTKTGTSATNVGLYSTASGGTTNLALSLLGGMKVQTGATGGDVDFLASGGSNWMRFDNTQIIRFQLGVSSNNRITPQTGGLEFMSPGGATVGYKYNFLSQAALTGTSGTNVLVALGENASGTRIGSTLSSGTTTNKMLLITGAWNFTGSYSGILQSIDIDPTLTSETGLTYIALRSTAASGKLLWGGTTVTSGSVLADFQSTTLGIMMPRVTNIASVATPVAGMIAYDAATDKFNFRQGSGWSLLGLTQALSGTQTGTAITSDANVTSTQSISAFSSTVTSAGVSTQVIYDPSVLSNNSTAEIEITVTGIKTDGTSSFSVSVKGLFRKDNSGTVTMDVAGTQDLKELTASTVVSLVPLVSSGYPSATLTMGASSGTYAIKGITKAIITKL